MPEDLKSHVLAALSDVAPEVDVSSLPDDVTIRDELDIDSMDFLNFVIGLKDETGVEVPESDYARVSTLAAGTSYLSAWSGRT